MTLYLAQKKPEFEWESFTKDVLVGCSNVKRGVQVLREHYEDLHQVGLADKISQSFVELQDQAELASLEDPHPPPLHEQAPENNQQHQSDEGEKNT